jgi:hypothetical protein
MVTAVPLSIVVRAAGREELPRLVARAGEAAPRPYTVGEPTPGRVLVSDSGALTPVL